MPNNVLSGPPGLLVSLLVHLRNAARKAGEPQPQSSATPAPGGNPAPGNPAPASPAPSGNAVRFDFSDRAASTVAAEQPLAAPTPAAQPQAVTSAPVAGTIPPQVMASAPLRSLPEAPAAMGVGTATASAGQPATTVLRDRPLLDDEAQARAWAIKSLARENVLGMVERVARMAERPEPIQAEAASSEQRFDQAQAEPRTLAVV